MCRNIWTVSDADTVTDTAGEMQVVGGYGAWRVNTEYVSDDVFEQDIKILPIYNPFCLHRDPASKDILGRDSDFWILEDEIKNEECEAKYPDVDLVDFGTEHSYKRDEHQEERRVTAAVTGHRIDTRRKSW